MNKKYSKRANNLKRIVCLVLAIGMIVTTFAGVMFTYL